MPKIVRTERYRRGPIGWLFKIVFVTFNVLMIAWMAMAISGFRQPNDAATQHPTAYAAGVGIGLTFILFVWALGSVVFGALSYFTRGKKVITEEVIG